MRKGIILAGGLGSRLNTYGKHNLKAFIEIDNETFQTLNLDSSIMSSWTSRMKETTKTFRRTPTPSPF